MNVMINSGEVPRGWDRRRVLRSVALGIGGALLTASVTGFVSGEISEGTMSPSRAAEPTILINTLTTDDNKQYADLSLV